MNRFNLMLLLALSAPVNAVNAADTTAEIASLRQLVEEMRLDYEARISELEARLAHSERVVRGAKQDADEAYRLAEQTAIDQSSGQSGPNVFNPAIGVVLTGRYADIDNGWA